MIDLRLGRPRRGVGRGRQEQVRCEALVVGDSRLKIVLVRRQVAGDEAAGATRVLVSSEESEMR